MSRDTTVIAFRQPEAVDDPLSELAREGARRMLAQVLIAAERPPCLSAGPKIRFPDGLRSNPRPGPLFRMPGRFFPTESSARRARKRSAKK
jgi:hypothetical protein